MVKLSLKDINTPPLILTDLESLKLLREVILAEDGKKFQTNHYKSDELYSLLKTLSLHKKLAKDNDKAKCYYCESQAEKAMKLQVEHYRPKAGIAKKDNNEKLHKGYYWLGMEWSNLVLACPNCNGRGAKGNRFPIRGIRAIKTNPVNELLELDRSGCLISAQALKDEDPLLLNPEVDDPADYMTFDMCSIIKGHGTDPERGDVSAEIYQLNRPILIGYRLSVWEEIKRDILEDIAMHQLGHYLERDLEVLWEKASRKLIRASAADQEFSLWVSYINDHIEDFIKSDIPPEYQGIFRKSYLSSKKNIGKANMQS